MAGRGPGGDLVAAARGRTSPIRTAGITDDPRYAAFAKEWGVNSPRRMFIFLQNQGFGSIPLVFAIFVAARFPAAALRLQDYLGALILFAGIAGEALADAQLKRFRERSRQQGPGLRCRAVALVAPSELFLRMVRLARLSRHRDLVDHPLYYPWGWATLLAPAFMYWILVHVTGIPPLEAQMLRSRGERYRDYQSRTSVFFPLPPQKRRWSHELRFHDHRHRRTGAAAGCRHSRRDPAAVLAHRDAGLPPAAPKAMPAFADEMAARAIAEHTDAANAQHYEVPAAFFAHVLGPNRKYSSCFYKEPASTLQEAEEEALRQTVEHADLADGQSILELGCGWGSLSLWMARQFPHSQITAVSNSHSQREYIEGEAAARGLKNLRVVTSDMNVFDPERSSTASCRSRCSST